ncbi:MAG: DNA mismatch repair endonuclease MutL [Alphaproteobacteria bacterium]|nr:DNA mismatch repair endonuclease MutL [Alphaproteobacteria bacterium]
MGIAEILPEAFSAEVEAGSASVKTSADQVSHCSPAEALSEGGSAQKTRPLQNTGADLRLDETANCPGIIRKLPESTINRIAAGEVVERPASAVKELIENALDAGASRIEIAISGGGAALISVDDNGSGMDAQSLGLAVLRHATSKLPVSPDGFDDLARIATLGFRGEALPSIGAAARLSIYSRMRGMDAHVIKVEGGQNLGIEPAGFLAGGQSGTRVEVRDLFFATPARLKFLRSPRAESLAALDAGRRLAIARPDVAFSFTDEGRLIFSVEAEASLFEGTLPRLARLIGRDFADNAIKIDAVRETIALSGFAGLPTYNRAAPNAQYLFVNGRPVKDRLLLGALKGAYADYLPKDRHPAVALFITCDPVLVDVNVHPAKAEVRFRDGALVRGLIVGALKSALHEHSHRAATSVSTTALGVLRLAAESVPARPPVQHALTGFAESLCPWINPPPSAVESRALPTSPVTSPQQDLSAAESLPDLPLGRAKGQLHDCYIVAETAKGVVIVDQHAAHERLVYERMKRARAEGTIRRQPLLIPEVVELDESAAERLAAQAGALTSLGLVIESFGPGAVLIREVPAEIDRADLRGLVHDLADELAETETLASLEERLNHVLATLACHMSVRSGRKLQLAEMNALLREMEATPHSGQCNHGRPTYVELKLSDIEHLFGRH